MQSKDRVRVQGDQGYYWVVRVRDDGSLDLWGGSKDPNGMRKSRTVPARFASPDTRKLERKGYPEFAR